MCRTIIASFTIEQDNLMVFTEMVDGGRWPAWNRVDSKVRKMWFAFSSTCRDSCVC